MDSGYQLPQSCGSGQVPKSDGSGGWSCQNDNTGSLPGAWVAATEFVDIGNIIGQTAVASINLPAGHYLLIGKGTMGLAGATDAAGLFNDGSSSADESDSCNLTIGGKVVDDSQWAQLTATQVLASSSS